ncbi:CmlA/FloR family chloramphenicol efflux MFS transporter [Rhizobium rhizogenes]|uniref:CmlA/FloR family chloramphenicol efflux MFS transporter n=1 Tax=Rhizobium rhizogenes TaxID=359 RepID=UPI0005684374|nr:CmlA/FloR family chloramphenicol efflux MFS transporter [Rhizobium rhizogenes]NTF80722.1 CmlA/FloR family chloramphenicol efflux MFS transporter [Rhizobium rhizogenes]NTH18166.1 CmlA/FloR family chloramphenicol efflux MFS transporter [Rhizobium rhizogenes]NTH31138.1 CmlA/FloR family chloramphenicol efflux MFS transporter [Rhizobium rhizogenes]NTH76794.1 CmlA/FloR family chloramphenicol efflux MFS transporter [Rhizobium rhizogenes]NTH82802.1 CmlA/FloR family chloramphenicol efflux MFS transp
MPSRIPTWNYRLPAALLLMAPFDILTSLAMDIYLPVVPIMPRALDTSPAVVQLTLSLYMLILGAGQIVFGPLSDIAGRRPVLLGGAALFAATSFLMAGTSSADLFMALRLLQAVGASAALVATFATVRDVYAERPEGAVIYSLLGSMLSFVPAVGPIAGALIANHFGWRAIFLALGILTLAAIFNATLRWDETRPVTVSRPKTAFRPILKDPSFWTYTIGFSAAMGAFFVFFSTAPRVLIDQAGFSSLAFSLAFATAALVMIATARFAGRFVKRWGTAGSLARGMLTLLVGATLLAGGELFLTPSFVSFVLPMWVIAIGIVFTTAVTANGALRAFGDTAGTAVALYFCVESLIVGLIGTLFVVILGGDTAWPLAGYCAVMALVTLFTLWRLQKRT